MKGKNPQGTPMSDASSKKCASSSDSEILLRNTKASKEAEGVFSLVDHPQPNRFYERLIELCKEKLPRQQVKKEPEPMTDQEAADFEQLQMPYGKYQGASIGAIHPEYFAKLVDPDPFNIRLKRYVASQRFRNRMHS
jgi:hypothetical protein